MGLMSKIVKKSLKKFESITTVFYIFGFHKDQPVVSSQSSDVPSHPTMAGEEDNIRQRQQSPPETQMNQSSSKSPFETGFYKPLIETKLNRAILGTKGSFLSDFVMRQGEISPLKEIWLARYSMAEYKWVELLQFTSTCKYLTYLDLSRNAIGEAGHQLAQSIKSWGDNSPLQTLYLHYCSIPEEIWNELLQSLSSCKQLTGLDLSGNTFGAAGHYLPKLIKSLGDNSQLNQLYLERCSIPSNICTELLQSLLYCKQLTYLNLSGNVIGEAAHHLVQLVIPLKVLHLNHCSIPEQVWAKLLQSLSSCKELCHLGLSGNAIGEVASYLAQSITSWGDNPALGWLHLNDCSIPKHIWLQVFHSLSSCGRLESLEFNENSLTGCLYSFLSEPNPGLTSLRNLELEQTAMNKSDIKHLTHLIQNSKLSRLKNVWLQEESYTDVQDEIRQLEEACQQNKISLLFRPIKRRKWEKKDKQVQNNSPFPIS